MHRGDNVTTTTAAQRFVPYAFARDHLILLRPLSERDAEVWIGESTPMQL